MNATRARQRTFSDPQRRDRVGTNKRSTMASQRFFRVIRRGAFASIYEMDTFECAPHASSDLVSTRRVVVKCVDLKLVRSARALLAAIDRRADDPWQEFRIATMLTANASDDDDAQHVVRYEHAATAEDGNTMWLVIEYCADGDLWDVMAAHGRPHWHERDALQLFTQVVRGVRFLHDRGIAHRDISLENVVVHNGVCKLTDFGLATDNPGHCTYRAGKDFYMAPEVVAGQTPYNGELADVWSLGIVLVIMLTGSPPFKRATPGDPVFDEFCSHGPKRYLELRHTEMAVSSNIVDLLEMMLEIEPSKRAAIHDVLARLTTANLDQE